MLETKKMKKQGNWEKRLQMLQKNGFHIVKADNDHILLFRDESGC